jgi:flagellar hook-basal body complex protein FliE
MLPISSIGSGYTAQVNSLPQALDVGKTAGTSPFSEIELQRINSLNGVGATEGASFENMLKGFVNQVNDKQQASVNAVNGVLAGNGVPLHQAVIAMEEACVAFQMMVEVRNRLLESYQEIMRMQV